MWKGGESVGHEDDTSESALYSNRCVRIATVFPSFSRIPTLIIGAGPRSPKGFSMVPGWCAGRKPSGEVAYVQQYDGGNVTGYSRQPRSVAFCEEQVGVTRSNFGV